VSAPVFLIGAPRSGTTWLQNLLGAHADIATPQELDLFSDYIAPWHAAWRFQFPEQEELWRRHRHKGLPSVLTREEFIRLGTTAVDSVYDRVLALKPGASVVVEKVPHYTHYTELIREHFPSAKIVHIVRDGRDVACSMIRASGSFGRTWATNSLDRAAWVWRDAVERGRAASESGDYLETRYELLRSGEGAAELARVLAFCGVDEAAAASIYDAFLLEPGRSVPSSIVWGGEVARRIDNVEEPQGFYGEGLVGGWRDGLSAYERWVFARAAGALLCELGYEESGEWARLGTLSTRTASLRLWSARQSSRLRFAAGAARHTWIDRPLGGMRPTGEAA
jgi:hypothetical protein